MSLRLLLLVGCLIPSLAVGAEEGSAPSAAPSAAAPRSAEEIGALVRQLESPKFAERQAATQELRQAGRAAIPALIEAGLSGAREASQRALDILRDHFNDGHPDAKQAAKEALEKIAAEGSPMARQTAQDALRPKEEELAQQPLPAQRGGVIVINGGQIRLAGGPIQIQMRGVAGPGQRIQVRNANGVKDIEVEDGDRKIKIHEEPTGKIQMEVTETKEGKPVTEKYEAKNADELKKNHPDAHKLYEKYQQGGGAQIQIQAAPGNILPMPLRPAAPQRALQPINPAAQQRLGAAQAKLRAAVERLRDSLQGNNGNPDADEVKEARAALDEAQQEIRAAVEGLREPVPPAEEKQP